MKSLAELMSVYQRYHWKPATRYTHFIGIPLVVYAVFVLLSWIHISIPHAFDLTAMWLAIILTLVYYFILDIRLALGMTAVFIILGLLAQLTSHNQPSTFSFYLFVATFILGWIFQIIGHLFEGRRPALVDNLFQLFVGPIFILAEIYFMLGWHKTLQDNVHVLAKQNPDEGI